MMEVKHCSKYLYVNIIIVCATQICYTIEVLEKTFLAIMASRMVMKSLQGILPKFIYS